MASNSPHPVAPEQRLLAVIVFTDVVSFTARMQADEPTTLKLLERDFAIMRQSSQRLAGTVLKTTGDGLLLYFTSAVRAMAWAMRMQRHFAEQAKTEPPDQILRHRVGIHLGDVYLRADDVMGDGVNIAARLMGEAPPGGICISQTVYEVVKNKLKLHVVRLEPRHLKNIKDAMQMYHVLPAAPARVAAAVAGGRVTVAEALPWSRPPSRFRKLAAVGLVLLGIGTVAGLMVRAYFNHEAELARSQATHIALGVALQKGQVPPNGTRGAKPPATVPGEELDFALLASGGGTDREANDPAIRQKANEALSPLYAWMNTTLQGYTAQRPLTVRPLRDGAVQELSVFTGPDRQLSLFQSGITLKRELKNLKAGDQAAIIMSALLYSPNPPREVMHGAEAFAYLHGQTEMAKALIDLRRP